MDNKELIYNGVKCSVICEGLKYVDRFCISIEYKVFFGEKGDFWTFEKLYNKKGDFWKYDFNNNKFDSLSELFVFMFENGFIYNR